MRSARLGGSDTTNAAAQVLWAHQAPRLPSRLVQSSSGHDACGTTSIVCTGGTFRTAYYIIVVSLRGGDSRPPAATLAVRTPRGKVMLKVRFVRFKGFILVDDGLSSDASYQVT